MRAPAAGFRQTDPHRRFRRAPPRAAPRAPTASQVTASSLREEGEDCPEAGRHPCRRHRYRRHRYRRRRYRRRRYHHRRYRRRRYRHRRYRRRRCRRRHHRRRPTHRRAGIGAARSAAARAARSAAAPEPPPEPPEAPDPEPPLPSSAAARLRRRRTGAAYATATPRPSLASALRRVSSAPGAAGNSGPLSLSFVIRFPSANHTTLATESLDPRERSGHERSCAFQTEIHTTRHST